MSGAEQTTDVVPDREPVPAYSKWEWDCPECGTSVLTEFPPPEDEECDVCGLKVRTDPR